MKIGQLARRAGIGVETVRFYERQGLLQPPIRSPSGYREYFPEDLTRLRFIRHAKGLGFSLSEVQDLLELRTASEASCPEVQERIGSKLEEVRRKIALLQKLETLLTDLSAQCASRPATHGCPLFDALLSLDDGAESLNASQAAADEL